MAEPAATTSPDLMPGQPAEADFIKRQAVVLIHGMGEQSPMETIRGFAASVWSQNVDLHANPPDGDRTRNMGELFHIPDLRAGSRELRRISTRKSRNRTSESGDQTEDCVRTDFFELYWADATRDSTWSDFVSWYWRLLLRSPADVPAGVFWVWIWLIFITVWLAQLTITLALWWPIHAATIPGRAFALDTARDVVLASAVIALSIVVARRIVGERKLGWLVSWFMYAAFALAAVAAVSYFAMSIYGRWHEAVENNYVWVALGLVLAYAAGIAIANFLVRFFGDVARYCLATPGNIAARKEIRERGLELVGGLQRDSRYERIVLVGHSLGTIVAYDILTLLWSDYVTQQPSDNGPDEQPYVARNSALRVALDVCIAAATGLEDQDKPAGLSHFRAAQRRVYAELRRGRHRAADPDQPLDDCGTHRFRRWLISDLVTIACPLTHAEFLLAPDKAGLAERFKRRELSTCPPAMEADGAGGWRLTYDDRTGTDGRRQRLIHDAAFAAVRWTNIFDKPKSRFLFLVGDVISGPVNSLFGRCIGERLNKLDTENHGILDVVVRPERDGSLLPARLFTHTTYWDWPGEQQGASGAQLNSVAVVRDALNLLDLSEVEARLVNRAC